MKNGSACFLCIAVVTLADRTSAKPDDESDVLICTPESAPTELATGIVDAISGAITVPQRVFVEAVIDSGLDDLRGNEGFFSVSDAALLPDGYLPPPGTTDINFGFHAFTIDGQSANLWFWDPVAQPALLFVPASNGQRLSFKKSPVQFFNATVDGAAVDVPGFVIDRTSAGGGLHKHLILVVDDGDTDPGTPVSPGIYVAAYTLSHPGGSSPLIIEIVNGGMGSSGDAAAQAAFEFFEDYLAPCPGDVNGDGQVDLSDLTVLLAHFGVASGALREDGDLDGNGRVDLADLTLLLSSFGVIC